MSKNATRKRIRKTELIIKIEYWIGRTFVTLLHYVPLPVAFYAGHFIGWCASLLPTKRRTIIANNLAVIDDYLAEKSPDSNLKQQVNQVFLRTGANIACSFRFARMPTNQIKKYIEVDGLDHLKTALSLKKGVLILLAHMGPWEVLPYLSEFLDEDIRSGAMYRPMNNDYFDNWFKSIREQRGTRLFSRRDGFHKPVDFLRNGGVLGVLADQKMRQGIIAPFFGKNVPTNPLPGLFQRRSGATAIGLSIKTSAPLKWTIKMFPVNYPSEKENRTREIEAKISNQAIERILLESPLDGFWFSERFYVKNESRNTHT